ncbi:Uncharacterized protein TCM_018384 [Theobroma cacao]|uniref:Uncharacterized protein n=1 Tax=Theobroma cacao TaxID=3641 RepID=A0A061EFG0_THECC|nr:Uncharacterized protein TCM_018384 [Theobroma cacao]
MVMDALRRDFQSNVRNENGRDIHEDPNLNVATFFLLLNDVDSDLWSGCTKHTKLPAMSQSLNVKSKFNMSETRFNCLMHLVKNMLPSDEALSENFYIMKKELKELGLSYLKIHSCKNNCLLFYNESFELSYCSRCGHLRYKLNKSKGGKEKKVPDKILRYLPLIPRL